VREQSFIATLGVDSAKISSPNDLAICAFSVARNSASQMPSALQFSAPSSDLSRSSLRTLKSELIPKKTNHGKQAINYLFASGTSNMLLSLCQWWIAAGDTK
jgi:hypothetical protein